MPGTAYHQLNCSSWAGRSWKKGAAAFGAEADRIRVVEEGEAVRAQPVVAEDDIRVAVHFISHEARLLVEAAQHRPR